MKKIFHYFVSYTFCSSYSYSYGVACAECQTNKEITSFEDIQRIADFIQEENEYKNTKVIILNYQLLRVEEENDDDDE